MNFNELLTKRRSIRDFEDKEVPLDLIKELINDSIMASNANHAQPWSFVIVNNKELIKKISDASKSALLAWIEEDPNSPAKDYKYLLENERF